MIVKGSVYLVKKVISGIIIGILIMLTATSYAASKIKSVYFNDNAKLQVNGKIITTEILTATKEGQTNGSNYVSARALAEAMGGIVDWKNNTVIVTSTAPNSSTTQTNEFEDGSIYSGNIFNGLPNGIGRTLYANGDIYDGQYKNGAMDGQGVIIHSNGDIYRGGFKGNLRNGVGRYYHFKDNSISFGTWVNDKLDGVCQISQSDGFIFTGNYKNGLMDGVWTLHTLNTDFTSQVYKDGKIVSRWEESINLNVIPEKIGVSYPLHLYSDEDKREYLGKLVTSKYDSDSVYNQYGDYGSKYSSKSIWNEFGNYGSKFSSHSPFNKYASHPPLIIDNKGNLVGKLTIKTTVTNAVNPNDLKAYLEKLKQ